MGGTALQVEPGLGKGREGGDRFWSVDSFLLFASSLMIQDWAVEEAAVIRSFASWACARTRRNKDTRPL